jgi:cell division septal protein FtsQ
MGIRISKRIRRLITSLLAISTIFASAYLLGWSSLLSVSQVSVSGSSAVNLVLSELSKNGIEPKIGDQLARVDVRSIKKTLGQLDWISNSDVSRNWFDKKLSIVVQERVAIAKTISAQNLSLNFDSKGFIFTPTSQKQLVAQSALPSVTSQSPSNGDLTSIAALLEQIPADLRYLLSDLESISITKSSFILMDTRHNSSTLRINWGGATDIGQKSKVLAALLKLPENKGIKQVDLSQPDSPIVS